MVKRAKPRAPYPRVRDASHSHTSAVSVYNVTTRKSNGVVVSDDSRTGVKLTRIEKSMKDVVTPGFAMMRDRGELVSHPMYSVAETYSPGSTGFAGVFDAPAYTLAQAFAMSGDVGTYVFGLPLPQTVNVDIDNLKIGASTQCMAGMRNSSFQGLVAAAELKKTLEQLASPLASLNAILAYASQVRVGGHNLRIVNSTHSITINGRTYPRPSAWLHKGPGRLVRPPKGNCIVPAGASISAAVLAYNLGIKPLMMDWNALVREIPKLHQEKRLSSRAMWHDEGSTTAVIAGGYSSFALPYRMTTNRKVSVRAYAFYEDAFDIMQDFGTTLLDVPEAAWELVPGSFIADYFINIGDILGALKASMSKQLLDSGLTVQIVDTVTRDFLGVTAANFKVSRSMSGTDSFERITKERLPGLSNPGLARIPLTSAIRPTVVQNLLSLTVQHLVKLTKLVK